MKTKILLIVSFISLCTILSSFQQMNDLGLARTEKTNGKIIFFWNEPINEYEVAFTFENTIPNFNCKSPSETIDASILNANKEAANQGKIFDAIIIGNSTKRDLAIIFKDKSKDNSIARVKRNEGKYVFIQCEPMANYDVVYKSDVSGVGQQILLGSCPSLQQKIDKLLKRASKSKEDFNGIIFGSSKNDLAIKLK